MYMCDPLSTSDCHIVKTGSKCGEVNVWILVQGRRKTWFDNVTVCEDNAAGLVHNEACGVSSRGRLGIKGTGGSYPQHHHSWHHKAQGLPPVVWWWTNTWQMLWERVKKWVMLVWWLVDMRRILLPPSFWLSLTDIFEVSIGRFIIRHWKHSHPHHHHHHCHSHSCHICHHRYYHHQHHSVTMCSQIAAKAVSYLVSVYLQSCLIEQLLVYRRRSITFLIESVDKL